jgi:hypothetical protein
MQYSVVLLLYHTQQIRQETDQVEEGFKGWVLIILSINSDRQTASFIYILHHLIEFCQRICNADLHATGNLLHKLGAQSKFAGSLPRQQSNRSEPSLGQHFNFDLSGIAFLEDNSLDTRPSRRIPEMADNAPPATTANPNSTAGATETTKVLDNPATETAAEKPAEVGLDFQILFTKLTA